MMRFGKGTTPHGRRGSTILIVLALLSVLVLVATTLTFTSRLEVISSQNFAQGIQNRASGISSIQQVAEQVSVNLEGDAASPLDFAIAATPLHVVEQLNEAVGSRFIGTTNAQSASRYDVQVSLPQLAATMHREGIRTPTSRVGFEDASARININTASQATLAALFQELLGRAGLNASAEDLARRIVDYRTPPAPENPSASTSQGPAVILPHRQSLSQLWETERQETGRNRRSSSALPFTGRVQHSYLPPEMNSPGAMRAFFEGRDAAALVEPDPRLPARSGERRFSSVSELALLRGFTPEVVAVLTPFLTVYSSSSGTFDGRSPLDINRATAEEIYTALKELYGSSKEDNLLRQFAVNIVDARDGDSTRTSLPASSGMGVVLGIERVPFITEVYPNSVTPAAQGNDGQFVEIYNPWDEPISLEGWKLKAGAGLHDLRGILPPGGFLIVTDDYDNSRDPGAREEIPGTGSFYDIFNMVPQGTHRRLLELPELSLPHGVGVHRLELQDLDGNLADQFTYRVTDANEVLRSFQRFNILLDESSLQRPTPFTITRLDPDLTDDLVERMGKMPKDGPFTDVLEIFDIFSGYANPGGERGRRFAFPVLATPNSRNEALRLLAEDPTLIDARVIDIFTVESLDRPGRAELLEGLAALRRTPVKDATGQTVTPARERSLIAQAAIGVSPRGTRHGMVNINTAPSPVLRAIGFSDVQAEAIVTHRRAVMDDFLRSASGEWVLWRSRSDILVDERVWGRIDPRDPGRVLSQAGPILRQLSTGSTSFFLEGQPGAGNDSQRVTASGAKVRALFAFDGGRPDLLWWEFIP